MGNPVLIYVAHRLVDVPAYWNVTRSWDSTTNTTTRTPDANGVYTIQMIPEGGEKTKYYTTNIAHVNAIDGNSDYVVGMQVDENNNILTVYDPECLFGYTAFCRGYYVTESTSVICQLLSPDGSGNVKNGVIAVNAAIYNVSAYDTHNEPTTIRYGDQVYCMKNPTGEIASIYITRRYLGEEYMFWNLERKYDSTNKVNTREPKNEGSYVFNLVQDGRLVTGKTQDKAIANSIDSYSAPGLCLTYDPFANTTEYETDTEGNRLVTEMIITGVYDGNYAFGGTKQSGRTVVAINGNEITVRTNSGDETTFTLNEDVKITNVSDRYENYQGELTNLSLGDYIYIYRDIYCNVKAIYIRYH
jgi:hypothetical protein